MRATVDDVEAWHRQRELLSVASKVGKVLVPQPGRAGLLSFCRLAWRLLRASGCQTVSWCTRLLAMLYLEPKNILCNFKKAPKTWMPLSAVVYSDGFLHVRTGNEEQAA